MRKEYQSDYYDKQYSVVDVYQLEIMAEHSPYFYLYKAAREKLTKDESIFELGCGTGQLAEWLIREGYNYMRGVDFSEVAVKMSRKRCKGEFRVEDLRTYTPDEADVYICLEVLEHVQDDIGILKRIPKGKRLILSVPTYLCRAHVRCFESEQDITERYGFLNEIKIERHKNIWLITAKS
jgi:2-polyprenyl-3-methyl-5-hydroxy-6-metoxy-1,4-benzoquinol methylase